MCSPECPTLEKTVDQLQLTFRIVKLRLRVLRSNIGKLLCLCVPEKEKWNEFGWVGKSVDEILDDLARYCSISIRNMSTKSKYKNLFQLGQPSKDKATCKKCGKVVTYNYINHVTSSMIYHSQHFHNEKIVNTAAALLSSKIKKKNTEDSSSSISMMKFRNIS